MTQKLLSPVCNAQLFDNAGKMLSNGTITVYIADTLTLAQIFSNEDGAPLANPITLNASGRIPVGQLFLDIGVSYDMQVKQGTTVLESYNGISGLLGTDSGVLGAILVDEFTGTGAQTSFTLEAAPFDADLVDVSINGLQLKKIDYNFIDNRIIFVQAPSLSDEIVVKQHRAIGVQLPSLYQRDRIYNSWSTTAGVLSYSLSNNPGKLENLIIVMDGLVLQKTIDYTWIVGSPLTLTLTVDPGTGKELSASYGDVLGILTPNTTDLVNYSTTGQVLTEFLDEFSSNAVGEGASRVGLEGSGTVQDLVERFSVPVIGVGDGVADDTAVIIAALARVASGGVAMCRPGKTYRITSGITIANNYQVLDLNGSSLLADFASGTAVTVGNGVSTVSALGIRNGVIKTTNPSTSLHGVIFKKNVRRRVEHGGLWISGFKGIGMQFEELNWSIQAKDAPLIENCGVNLDINDNGNAITISGIGLDGASSYNARLRGTVAVTFVGGYIQNAGTAGILLDMGTVGALQQSLNTSLFGVYLEANGTSHIIGNGGKGLTVRGCFINCNTMTGQTIDLNSWTGADIAGNTPQNTGGRDFVNADSASTLICVGRQNVTTLTDVVIGGSVDAYVSPGFPTQLSTLPVASLVNRGTQMLLAETGTAANSSRPYVCLDAASGSRTFRQIALQGRKQGAAAGGATLTPDLGALETFDLTLLAGGITVNAPTGPFKDGDEITFIFKQSAAPTGAVVWNAVYKTDLSSTLLASSYATVQFVYSGGRSLWVQVGKMEWKV